MSKKYFGTDGIRGRLGESTIHPEFVLKLGWAVGRVLANHHRRRVIIGKDTRISGYLLESALQAGLSAAGVDVKLLGPIPTPAIAYLTRTLRASVGIVISASHNPYYDNGIKFFAADGRKLSDEVELAIEKQMQQPFETMDSAHLGRAERIDDAAGRYIEFCKSTIPHRTSLRGLKIVLDCANGATYHIAPNVFKELGAKIITLSTEPDGFNINAQCGSVYPEALQARVQTEQADLGIAFDGDGDRVIMVDHQGKLVNGDEILFMIAKDEHDQGTLDGGIVGTEMTNLGLEARLAEMKTPFVRTDVGDRYVMQALLERNWWLGGESSGHIICLDKTTTGDGIVAALQVLHAMQRNEKSLAELAADMHTFPQILINVPTANAQLICTHPKLKAATAEAKADLPNPGRILLRPSGTEPLLRIMVESLQEDSSRRAAEYIASIAQEIALQ